MELFILTPVQPFGFSIVPPWAFSHYGPSLTMRVSNAHPLKFPRWNCISRTNIPLPSGSAILALPWKNHVCAMCIHVCIYLMDTGLRRHGSWRGGASGSGIIDTQSQAPGLNTTSPVWFWRQFNDIVSQQISSQWWRLSVNRNQILVYDGPHKSAPS